MIETIGTKFSQGGIFMWIILVVLAVAFAVVVERLIFYLIICRKPGLKKAAVIISSLKKGSTSEAEKTVERGSSPVEVLLNRIVKSYNAGLEYEQIQHSVEEAAVRELPRYSTRLNYLSLFANISTLLGLLGTISGLQLSFTSLATVEAAKKAAMLADGISRAMNTTAFGLIVAVPCMILFTMLSNKKEALVKELDESVLRVMNFIKDSRK